MRLCKVKLVNVCQYENKTVEFPLGLTVICGSNGVGKSNLMNMARLSVTNDFSSVPGAKESNIRRGTPQGDLSYIETTWEVTSGTMVVRRVLQGGSSLLTLNNKEVAKGKETVITEKALELLGTTAATINEFLFASQNALQNIISGGKADRAAMFQSLCGLDVLEKLDRVLRDQVTMDKGIISTYRPDLHDRLVAEWRSKKKNRRDYRKQMHEVSATVLPDFRVQELKAIVSRAEDCKSLSKDIAEDTSRLEECETALAFKKSKLKHAEDAVDEAQTDVNEYREIHELSRSRYDAMRSFPSREIVNKHLRTLSAELPQEPPVPKADPDELASLKLTIVNCLKITEGQIEEETVCASCGRAFDNAEEIAKRVEQLREQKRAAKISLSDARLRFNELMEATAIWSRYESSLEKLMLERKLAQAAIDQIKSAPYGEEYLLGHDVEEEETETRSNLRNAEARLKAATDACTNLSHEITSIEVNIAMTRETIEKNKKRLEAISGKGGSVKLAKELLATHETDLAALKDVRDLYNSATNSLRATLTSLWQVREAGIRTKRVRDFANYASTLRNILHRDRLPARIIAGTLSQTTDKVNDLLRDFNAPFTVEVDPENFSFNAIHRDGSIEQAARLSVGQQVALAISFWLGRSAVFVGRLPFFCLDEPTAHLDEERVMQAVDVFERLSSELKATGRQGIVITHHRALSVVGHSLDLGQDSR